MAYLAGTVLIGCVWGLLYWRRKDVRKDMLWSSWYYCFVLTLGFIALKVLVIASAVTSINPGYWHPESLFDLNARTGGYGIEDAFFMFFAGGIAAVLFEVLFRTHVGYRKLTHRPHHAVVVGAVAAAVVATLHVNLIYSLIVFGYTGAVVVWWQRRDLITHSLLGGVSFLLVYSGCYLLITLLYPDFVTRTYNFADISGITLFRIPIEEYFFAFGLGLMWSPLYEYMRDVR